MTDRTEIFASSTLTALQYTLSVFMFWDYCFLNILIMLPVLTGSCSSRVEEPCKQGTVTRGNIEKERQYEKTHPSLKGISRKIVTRELVYYILLGTPRSVQKCLWSNLTADFLGDNHLFLICDQMTHQILQLMGYLDSW